jgi:hypothetical protein
LTGVWGSGSTERAASHWAASSTICRL